MADRILEQIYAARLERVREAEATVPLSALKSQAASRPRAYDFAGALRSSMPAMIAEVKKGSPSKGVFHERFDPLALAQSYAAGGAAALSVVTEPDFFWGRLEWVGLIRQALELPILRKDFLFSEYQVWESRAAGADAILLILAMLSDHDASRLMKEADQAGLQCLVEVHNESEADRACKLNATLVGVNNRDLRSFEVNLQTSEKLASRLPSGAVRVAESGITSHADCVRLAACGYQAFLVGETLVTASDPAAQLRSLRGVDAEN